MVLISGPVRLPTTSARKVQEPLAGMVAPLRLISLSPASALTTPPEQVVEAAGVAYTATPTGRVSVNDTPVSGTLALLVMVTVSVLFCPTRTALGLNALAMVGTLTTASVALAGFWLVTPWSVTIWKAGMMLL